ncbi:hypothetical protein BC828DRAFT_390929 [Blastocladiella britannica]|nr:hypothetical protein BC828DRAFT_390929 [Blastocladiella britannica]
MDLLLWWTEHGLRFKFTDDALDYASQFNFLSILEWWAQTGHKLKVSEVGVNQAARAGHLQVLSFWRTHLPDYQFRQLTNTCMDEATDANCLASLNWFRDQGVWGYTSDAIDFAARNSNIGLLQWWYDAGVPLEYSLAAYRNAGSYEVSEWWTKMGLDRGAPPSPTAKQLAKVAVPDEEEEEAFSPFDDDADKVSLLSLDSAVVFKFEIDQLCRDGDIEAVREWFESGDHSRYSEDALDYASYNDTPEIIEMWFKSGLPLRYTHKALDIASEEGHIQVLDAWKASGNELLYSAASMDESSASGHLHVLHWWMLSGLELLYTEAAMDRASGGDHLKVLEWWTRSGLPVMYSENALLLASANGCIQALSWWHNSYFQLKYDRVACAVAATENTQVGALVWWHKFTDEPFPAQAIDAAIIDDDLDMARWWLTQGRTDGWNVEPVSDEMRDLLLRSLEGNLTDIEDSDAEEHSDHSDDDEEEEEDDDDDEEEEEEEAKTDLVVVIQETTKDAAVPLDEKLDEALAGVALAVEELEQ